jgi:hypothetical protein
MLPRGRPTVSPPVSRPALFAAALHPDKTTPVTKAAHMRKIRLIVI